MACNGGRGVCPQAQDGGTAGWWGIYVSVDGGATFRPLIANADVADYDDEFSQTFYDNAIAVDPLDPRHLHLGLIHLWLVDTQTGQVCSISSPSFPEGPRDRDSDNPTGICFAWGSARFTLKQGIHCDQHALGFDRAGRLYVSNDGGVFSSPPRSRGAVWSNLNTNLALTQFYPGVADDTKNPRRLLAGTQDNGTQHWDGTLWQVTYPGDGAYNVMSGLNPVNDWIVSYSLLTLAATRNGRRLWNLEGGPAHVSATSGFQLNPNGEVEKDAGLDVRPVLGALFIAPFGADPRNPRTLLAGADRPYLSTSGGASWRRFGLGLPNVPVTDLSLDPDRSVMYAATHGRGAWQITVNP